VKKSKFTEEQIAFALKQAELGTPVEEVCCKMGISDATFYNWRKKYGGLGPSALRRLNSPLHSFSGNLARACNQ
jgi:putative transposase